MKQTFRTILAGAAVLVIPAFAFAAPQDETPNAQAGAKTNYVMPDLSVPQCPLPMGMRGMGQGMGPGNQDCPMMPGMGPMNGLGMGQGQGLGMGRMNGRGMGPMNGSGMQRFGKGPCIPEPFLSRMEAQHVEGMALRQAWVEAVAARGDKPVEEVKAAFLKANAAKIAKLEAEAQHLREDMEAIRKGLDLPFKKGMGRMNADPMGADPEDDFAPQELRTQIATEMAQKLNKVKGVITPEILEQIRKDVFAKHSEEFGDAFRYGIMQKFGRMDGMMPPPPHMMPELARMRKAMGDTRNVSVRDRKEFRKCIRNAMRIENAAEREAAIDALLSELHDKAGSDDGRKPAPLDQP